MKPTEAIKQKLDEQGHKQKWLASQIGYSEIHVSKVLNEKIKASDKFLKSACLKLGINFFDFDDNFKTHTA
jgi:antitoxin component HigA of HigAB toxin-antitoxin module